MSGAFTLAEEQHRALREFLTGQLNPDWADDYASWEEAVRDLVRWNLQTAEDALVSLDEVMRIATDEASATHMLDEIGFVGFLPSKMGPSVLGWLRELRSEFAKALDIARDPHVK